MKKIILLIIVFYLFLSKNIYSQPFADIASYSYQTFTGHYKDRSDWKNKTDDYFLNLFLPKAFKNGNTFLLRINSEYINSSFSPYNSYSSSLSSISIPIGIKLATKNKKWETIVLVIPKIASDFKTEINVYDYQYGGIALQHFIPNDKVKIKAGLYFNHEAFGDFYVPLIGVDWKINKRLYLYGILPTNYKIEFNILPRTFFAGINLKYFTRSFRLSKNYGHDYIRYDEAQIKLFLDYFIFPKILLFAELGYSFGKNPIQFKYATKEENSFFNPMYSKLNNYLTFNCGVAYRIRFDLIKSSNL